MDDKRTFDAHGAAKVISECDGLTAKMIDDEVHLVSKGSIPAPKGTIAEKLTTLLTVRSIRSQSELAAAAIELIKTNELDLDGAFLTRVIKAGFPKASVDKRHGPHYLSLARTGNLSGLTEGRLKGVVIAHERRAPRQTKAAEPKKGEVVEGPQAKASGKAAPAKKAANA